MSQPAFSIAKLAKVLAQFGAEHDGVVLNAARAAHQMVQAAGVTWDAVLSSPPGTSFDAPDAPVQFGARLIRPPHGGRWIATALFLIREADRRGGRVTSTDRQWLARRMAAWASRPIRGDEAAMLVDIHRRATELPSPVGGA